MFPAGKLPSRRRTKEDQHLFTSCCICFRLLLPEVLKVLREKKGLTGMTDFAKFKGECATPRLGEGERDTSPDWALIVHFVAPGRGLGEFGQPGALVTAFPFPGARRRSGALRSVSLPAADARCTLARH